METTTITITRDKLYPTPGRSYFVAWKWTYRWTGANNEHMIYLEDQDRTVDIGSYGEHLASLRAMLRRKFGRNATIIEVWK